MYAGNRLLENLQRAALLVLSLLIQELSHSYAASSAPWSQSTDSIVEYFQDWSARVSRVRSEQPGWISPLVATNPRLLQLFRYDQLW
jgi:hypothetical protein